MTKNSKKLKARTPQAQHWYDISLGNSHLHIALIVSYQSDFLRTDIYIPNDKPLFQKLYDKKDEIEKELGFSLIWEELPNAKASRLKLQKDNVNLKDKSKYSEYFAWYVEISEKYATVFSKYW